LLVPRCAINLAKRSNTHVPKIAKGALPQHHYSRVHATQHLLIKARSGSIGGNVVVIVVPEFSIEGSTTSTVLHVSR
jgi:hypothetical protein